MGLKKLAAKLAEYNQRLESGKTSKIKPGHVEKILQTLRSKVAELEVDIAAEPSADRRAQLDKKLKVARAHVERAEWLLKELE